MLMPISFWARLMYFTSKNTSLIEFRIRPPREGYKISMEIPFGNSAIWPAIKRSITNTILIRPDSRTLMNLAFHSDHRIRYAFSNAYSLNNASWCAIKEKLSKIFLSSHSSIVRASTSCNRFAPLLFPCGTLSLIQISDLKGPSRVGHWKLLAHG